MTQTGRPSQLLRRKSWLVLNQDRHVQGKGGRHNGKLVEEFSLSYISHAQNVPQGKYEMAISLMLAAFSGAMY